MLPRRKLWAVWLLLSTLFIGAQGSVHAQDINSWWQKANTLYAGQQYDSALYYYRQIEAKGFQNEALFYNMGNIFYRLGQTAPSVLYYEKALFKDPLNQKAKDNLALAEARVALPIAPVKPVFFISWWQQFKLLIAPQVWAWAMLICFVAGLWLLYKRMKEQPGVHYIGRWLALALAGFVFSGICFYASYQARTISDKAVIMQPDTPLFTKPGREDADGALPEGAVVTIEKEQAGWYFVTLPNGSQAWVAGGHLRKVQD